MSIFDDFSKTVTNFLDSFKSKKGLYTFKAKFIGYDKEIEVQEEVQILEELKEYFRVKHLQVIHTSEFLSDSIKQSIPSKCPTLIKKELIKPLE